MYVSQSYLGMSIELLHLESFENEPSVSSSTETNSVYVSDNW